MEGKYEQLKEDVLDEMEAIEQVLKDLSHNPPQGKNPVFDKNIVDRLNPYRGFRHLFVSGYGFKLRIDLMTSLINNIEPIWIDIKSDVEKFWDNL